MNTFIRYKLILLASLFLTCCGEEQFSINYGDLSTYSAAGHLQMVVEIPAGTNVKLEYDIETNTFPVDKKNGKDRVIEFLPYPGNYGFIPSTIMDISRGGDGDAVDILLLSEHLPTGTIIEVLPIGVLVLEDSGEKDSKIIVVPIDESLRIMRTHSYESFHSEFFEAKQLIQLWFLGYKEGSVIKFISWKDEKAARIEIEKWSIKK
jgi:inorganic pyrophosphatase|tara:strand:+ start:241 stop:858 length:618 start_codon:yes stop_codon:yes gene_type:complete